MFPFAFAFCSEKQQDGDRNFNVKVTVIRSCVKQAFKRIVDSVSTELNKSILKEDTFVRRSFLPLRVLTEIPERLFPQNS